MSGLSFDHVALTVADIERSVAFYEAFGFKKVIDYQDEDTGLNLVHMQLGECYIELFAKADVKPGVVSNEFAGDIDTIGLKHLALRSEDLKASVGALKKKGIEPEAGIKAGRTVKYLAFFRDPDGNWVEIAQR